MIEGIREGMAIAALHPARNVAAERRRSFEVDPALQFRLLRALRGSGRSIMGCYHSHPDGPAEPSASDAALAGEEDFLWLIVGVVNGKTSLGAHLWKNGAFHPVSIGQAD